MLLIIIPILFILISLITINTIFSVIGTMPSIADNPDAKASFEKSRVATIKVIYPIYLEIGCIISSGLYLNAVVTDHFDGLRHLLNFAGMQTFSYKTGIVLAEYTLYLVSILSCIIVGIILQIDTF